MELPGGPHPSASERELLAPAVQRILALSARATPARATLVGLSGIDASGKGYLAVRLARMLEARGRRVAVLGVDGWLNLPHVRFSIQDPGGHFYEQGLRLRELFTELVLPLREHRSISLEMDYAGETARAFRRHQFEFQNREVVIVEGIFLFKREFRQHFDLACWVECSFATAEHRAILRRQEGLPPAETIRALRTTYWPAQRVHFVRDQPRAGADLILLNDPGGARRHANGPGWG